MRISDLYQSEPSPITREKIDKLPEKQIHIPADRMEEDKASVGSIASAVSSTLTASEARVAELRKQYAAGDYKVDAMAISARMINEHLDRQ